MLPAAMTVGHWAYQQYTCFSAFRAADMIGGQNASLLAH